MRPELIKSALDMSVRSLRLIGQGKTVALVPTMGALHDGHLGLIEAAASTADEVIVSIFVNPTQFGPTEDLEAYPRDLETDMALLSKHGKTSIVFAPSVAQMYPLEENKTWVIVEDLDQYLCGASRPGHFKGVTTIVSKLLAIVQPDLAFFGLKDVQQFYIVKRMALEQGFRTQIVGVPTVREADGLALSSRNRYLSTKERHEAVVLSKAVLLAKKAIETGSVKTGVEVTGLLRAELNRADRGKVDYATVVDTQLLRPVNQLKSGQQIISAVAVQFGSARLIDNSIALVP